MTRDLADTVKGREQRIAELLHEYHCLPDACYRPIVGALEDLIEAELAQATANILRDLEVAKQTVDGWTVDSDGYSLIHKDVISKAVNAAIAAAQGGKA
jgi:hypothetical protein